MRNTDLAAILALILFGAAAFFVAVPDGNRELLAAVIGALAGYVSRPTGTSP